MSPFLECTARRTRPVAECLTVVCGDGTWHAQVDELLESLEPTQWDWLALPGGPAALCAHATSFRDHHVARRKLGMLVRRHQTRRVALVAHDFCGHYEFEHPNLGSDLMRDLQRRHLQFAIRSVQRWHPEVTVEAFLLRGELDGSCWVEKVGR